MIYSFTAPISAAALIDPNSSSFAKSAAISAAADYKREVFLCPISYIISRSISNYFHR